MNVLVKRVVLKKEVLGKTKTKDYLHIELPTTLSKHGGYCAFTFHGDSRCKHFLGAVVSTIRKQTIWAQHGLRSIIHREDMPALPPPPTPY